METDKLYRSVLASVCGNMGVDENNLFKSNKEEYVDARAVLVHVLIGKGMTEREIVAKTGLTQQCINKLKNNFHYRLRKWRVTTSLQSINNEITTR